MLPNNTILISIQPHFAAKIFEGSKAVELRRVRPKIQKGDVALVYVSSPVKALYGAFSIDRVVVTSPPKLWNDVKDIAGVSRAEFDSYYKGATLGVGIYINLDSLRELIAPLGLDGLRRHWPEFQPPQSYRYLKSILEEYERCPRHVKDLIGSVGSDQPVNYMEADCGSCVLVNHERNRFYATHLSNCNHAA